MAQAEEIKLIPTSLPHIFMCDVDDSGFMKEIAVVKKFNDGSIYYIEIEGLHNVDKSRIKKIVTGIHAKKYELWELMSESRLNNGMIALDFFHANNVKLKRAKGGRAAIGQGLSSILTASNSSDALIGAEFSNPEEATLSGGNIRALS